MKPTTYIANRRLILVTDRGEEIDISDFDLGRQEHFLDKLRAHEAGIIYNDSFCPFAPHINDRLIAQTELTIEALAKYRKKCSK